MKAESLPPGPLVEQAGRDCTQHITSDGTCSRKRTCFPAPRYARMGAMQGRQGSFAGDKQREMVRQDDCGRRVQGRDSVAGFVQLRGQGGFDWSVDGKEERLL